MLMTEWNWDDAKRVWQREATEKADEKWQSVVVEKDTIISEQDTIISEQAEEIAELKARLENKS